jgi:ribosomal protein S18 acetylase RimI-like enzyme
MARAFDDDPLAAWIFPNARTRMAKMTAMSEIVMPRTLAANSMEQYTTTDRSGLAVWGRPGEPEPPGRVMLPVIPRLVRTLGLGSLRRFTRATATLKKVHPTEPHWYLAGIGTDPPKQGMGVGSALVRQMLERCDADRMPAYLETQKKDNVPWYEKFGFRITGEIDIPGGGPHMWLMWRDPQ